MCLNIENTVWYSKFALTRRRGIDVFCNSLYEEKNLLAKTPGLSYQNST